MSVYPYIWRRPSLYPNWSCCPSYLFFSHPRSSSKNKSPGGVGWPQAANEPSANTHKAAQRGTTEINENLKWRSMSESQDSKGTAGVKFSHHSNL